MERLKTLVILALLCVIAGGAVWAATSGETEVRIVARRLADGRTEFGLQQRVSGAWGETQLPASRYFPAQVEHERWLHSSPVKLSAPIMDDAMQELAGEPAGTPPAPSVAEPDRTGQSTPNDNAAPPPPQHQPVEVEWKDLSTANASRFYLWQGAELHYADDVDIAYVQSTLVTTSSGAGVRLRMSCIITEHDATGLGLEFSDPTAPAHRLFEADPSTWRWSDRWQDRADNAHVFDQPFTTIERSGGRVSAFTVPTTETWESLTSASAVKIFYRDGRDYRSFELGWTNIFESYVGDNLRSCLTSVFPDWARERVEAERSVHRSEDGGAFVRYDRAITKERSDGLRLHLSCIVREDGSSEPRLTLSDSSSTPHEIFDYDMSRWQLSVAKKNIGQDTPTSPDPPFSARGSEEFTGFAVLTPTADTLARLAGARTITIAYGERSTVVWNEQLKEWIDSTETVSVDLRVDDGLWETYVGRKLGNCFDLQFPWWARASIENGGGGSPDGRSATAESGE